MQMYRIFPQNICSAVRFCAAKQGTKTDPLLPQTEASVALMDVRVNAIQNTKCT